MPENYKDLKQGWAYQTAEEGEGPVDGVKHHGSPATEYFDAPGQNDKEIAYPSNLKP